MPGSVFKIVTAVAGLGSESITPDTTYKQQPAAEKTGLLVDGFRVRDGHHPETGSTALDLDRRDRGVVQHLLRADRAPDRRCQPRRVRRRGWASGPPLPFDLPTAVSQVTNGDGKQPGGFTDDVELANASYGQAETFVTPLQMALVASTVANDGELMQPRLVTAMTGKRSGTRTIGPTSMGRVISTTDAQSITTAMVAGGRGRRSGGSSRRAPRCPGVTTAGKSGTAELGGTGEPHSWFIGFAPAENPEGRDRGHRRAGRSRRRGRGADRRRPDDAVPEGCGDDRTERAGRTGPPARAARAARRRRASRDR